MRDSYIVYQNRHQMKMMSSRAIAPIGAYWRIMALRLMFRAAFRYFSDSERSEVERCDIPEGLVKQGLNEGGWGRTV